MWSFSAMSEYETKILDTVKKNPVLFNGSAEKVHSVHGPHTV